MKKFLVGFALPAAAAIAVVGSGFAVWVFGTDAKTQSEDKASINVTQLVKIGNFTQAATSTVYLDQTGDGRNKSFNNATDYLGKDIEANGIYMGNFSTNDSTIKYNGLDATDAVDHFSEKVKVQKKTYIFVAKDVHTYVKVNGADGYTFPGEGYSTPTATYGSTDWVGYVYTWPGKSAGEQQTESIQLPDLDHHETGAAFTFAYQTDKEPTNATDYGTMKTAVEGKSIVIISEANLVKA